MIALRAASGRTAIRGLVLLGPVVALLASQAAVQPVPPASIADLQPVEQDDRILVAEPQVEVRPDGTAAVTFETMVAAPGARVFVGMLNPDAVLDTPMYRLEAREALKEPATAHQVVFDIKRVETGVGIAPKSAAHDADVYVRLEVFDSRTVGAKYYEWRFHYFADGGRFEKRTAVRLGPAVSQVTRSSAVVAFTTDQAARSLIKVFAADGKTLHASVPGDREAKTDHRVSVGGLQTGAVYRYQVVLLDQAGTTALTTGRLYTFRTAPAPGRRFSFAFMSDGRAGLGGGFSNVSGVNATVTRQLMFDSFRRGAQLILFGGDLASGYTSSVENFGMMLDSWKAVVDPVAHVIPIYAGFGNHESLHEFFRDAAGNRYERDRVGAVTSESEFARRFANPDQSYPDPEVRDGRTGPSYRGTVYSFDFGNAHFVMLNTDYWYTSGGPAGDRGLAWRLLGGNRDGYLMDNQLKWLSADLAAARRRGVAHIFVCGHDPAFPTGGHAADAMWWRGLNDPALPSGDVRAMRTRFLKIVNEHRVTALFVGHEHAYSRLVVDRVVDPAVTVPMTQFVSGGAGAPAYLQDATVPWAKSVRKYAVVFHYLLVTVDGPVASFSAIDVDGNVIDSGNLRAAR